ncbi:ParB family transcriptional regulator, chromosome partitioning protein [Gammaproteobacteria bacterium]
MMSQEIPVSSISVMSRRRPIDSSVVDELKQSINQQGLLQNIGVKDSENGYQLVFGAHRLEAIKSLEWELVPVKVFPASTSDDECLLAEIQENLTRKELTKGERKAFAAEVGRIISILSENSQQPENSQWKNNWFREFFVQTGIPQTTANNWWISFCKETGREITPKKANSEDRQAFFSWLEKQKQKEAEDTKRKSEEAEAEKARKIEETKQKAMEKFKADLFDALDQSVLEYGKETAMTWVNEWILHQTAK